MSMIKGKWIEDDSIGSNHIIDNAVVEAAINTGAVTENKIGTGAVTESKIGTAAVTTDKIADGNVADSKLASTFVKADGSVAMTGNLNLGTNKIINLVNPTNPNDAVNLHTLEEAIAEAEMGGPWQESVINRIPTPPLTPSVGDRYLITATATGDWIGREDDIATWNGTTWEYATPVIGWFTSSLAPADANKLFYFGGSSWETKEFEATTAGSGLTLTGRELSFNEGNGLEVTVGNNINVKPDSTSASATIAKVINVDSNGVAVKVDSTTIGENVSGQLEVVDGGINTDQLADLGVTNDKLAGSISDDKLNQIATADKVAAGAIDVSTAVPGRLEADGFSASDETITNVADPVNDTDAANKRWVLSQLSTEAGMISEQFTLSATDITNKYVTLAQQPLNNAHVVLHVVGGTTQHYENDYTIVFSTPEYRLSWNGKNLDGILAATDVLRVVYPV